jgi:CDP-glycerol glycerophosphotransferase (TagB/SpsB family)
MVFVYMPTFRDYGHWDNGLNLARLNTFLADNNALLLIRSHPIDQSIKDIDPAFTRIIKSTPVPGSWDDAYEELVGSDVLITDYSSLLFEYLLVDQPILLYHPDRKKYENSRHFGVDFEQIKPSESITEFDELLKAMEQCLSGSFDKTLLKKSKQLIHSLTDDASSQRVYDAICERI